MEFRLLGPLEIVDDEGHSIAVRTGHQRALLAVLLLHANEPLSTDRLIDELWGERSPPTAAKIVQNCVSQLRRTLGDQRLVTRDHSYLLHVEDRELDVATFDALVKAGTDALARDRPELAAETLARALSLWRGPALADFSLDEFAQAPIRRLDELRLAAVEARIEADLADGRHTEVIGELEELVAANPLRERFRAQLMLALYRSGRQAEALDAYREARRAFAEELGLEPSEELRELERAILTHDPSLAPPPGPIVPAPQPAEQARRLAVRPRLLVAAGAVLLIAAGIAVAVLELTRGASVRPVAIAPDSVAVVDPKTERVVAQIPVGARPMAIAAGAGAVWVANADDETVSRIDAKTRKVVKTIGVGLPVSDIAVGEGAVWVAGGPVGKVVRIDPDTNAVVQTLDLSGPDKLAPAGAYTLAVGAGAVWVSSGSGNILRLDPKTGALRGSVAVGQTPVEVAIAGGDVWTALLDGTTIRIEPNSKLVTRMTGPSAPLSVAAGGGFVWVGDEGPAFAPPGSPAVWRIAPATVSPLQQIPVRGEPIGIAVGSGAVWVACGPGGLARIGLRTGKVLRVLALGGPLDVAVADRLVWVTVGDKKTFAS
ncbi:MAG: BTAD domain-containing putative transcriptional regulator [Verrucomicrobiota bacterium]